jgi:lipopolysaccharide/colanic/teichoic acid biosynthesis glycosyltransferase
MIGFQSNEQASRQDIMRHESDRQSLREHPQEPHKIANGSAPARVDFSIECAVPARYEWYVPLKGAADCLLGVLLLVITAPITLLAAIAIKLTSRGPAFYCQTRQGRNGNPFTLYKLRTMVDKAEAATGPIWSTKDDARVTRLGAVLRKTHIDEFPQLVNVICGEMSLIGPRPALPSEVTQFDARLASRHDVRPGVTGLWQVSGRNQTTYAEHVEMDSYYARNWSLWLDLYILLLTVRVVLFREGAY